MKLGIVGLPNVGKSTLFNAITKAGAEAANYPFCTIEPNTGVVTVPDARLEALAKLYNPKRVTHAVVEFVDIAGLVAGASKGEGLGNKFLGHIRSVDAIVHVVRCFDDDNITHVSGRVDPLSDIETIDLELGLADIEHLGRRIEKSQKAAKGDKKFAHEVELLTRLKEHLDGGNPARTFEPSDDIDAEILDSCELLTRKPILYAANTDEQGFKSVESNPFYIAVCNRAANENAEVIAICAKTEEEIASLDDPEEQALFLADLGLEESGLDRLIRQSYHLLGQISFLTAGEPEVRAWTIRRGTKAPAAAGKIHSDIERGFIRAECIDWTELVACGSLAAAKEKGLVRSEGKEYVMQDGDVVLYRFNI